MEKIPLDFFHQGEKSLRRKTKVSMTELQNRVSKIDSDEVHVHLSHQGVLKAGVAQRPSFAPSVFKHRS